MRRDKWWLHPLVQWADLLALILVAGGILVLMRGGFVLLVADVRISVRSGSRLLLWAAGVMAVRHAFAPSPTLPQRMAGLARTAATRIGFAAGRLWRAGQLSAVSAGNDPPRTAFVLPRDSTVKPGEPRRYRADIDGLRGIAVLAVLAFHANASWAAGGFTGVDVFFVISGFLISDIIISSLERDTFRIADFYARRVRRIFPALVVVLGATWVAGWILLLPDAYQQLGRHIAGGAGFIANIVNWRESGYFDAGADQKPLLHLWSLGVEEQFYLLWPAFLILCWKKRFNLTAALGAVAAASFIVNVCSIQSFPNATFYLPASRIWELAAGGFLAVLCRTDAGLAQALSRRSRSAASLIGATLIGIAMIAVDRTQPFPGWAALLPVIGTFLVIAAGEDGWLNRQVLSNRALVFVGLVSYPLYLWHWPLLTFARLTMLRGLTVAEMAGALGAAFILAAMTYRVLERPVRAAAHLRRRQVVSGLAAAMMVVAVGGVWTAARGGLPARFDAALAPIANFSYEYRREYRQDICFLSGGQSPGGFGASCVDPETNSERPTVVLWGDSHAAHLYPGLRHLQRTHDFRLAQFTASACPPFPGSRRLDGKSRPHCPNIYDYVGAAIQQLKPATVVLAAQWAGYQDLSPLTVTVEFVRRVSDATIVLVGPVPQWRQPLPRVLLTAFQRDPLHRIPSRTMVGTWLFTDLDRQLRDFAGRLGLSYVSALDILCNNDGCLTRGDRPEALVAWDDSHLTTVGSEIVMDAASPLLFNTNSKHANASTH